MADRYHEVGKRLDEWEQTAKAATPGPWAQEAIGSEGFEVRGQPRRDYQDRPIHRIRVARCTWETWDVDAQNAEHIATFDPATMLRLIRALRHLIATARPRDTDRIIDAILGPEDGQ